MVSKAADKSRRVRTETWVALEAVRMSLTTQKRAVSVL